MPLGSESSQVTLHENGCLNGWWVRIWIGAGGETSCAEECLDLFQNIILLSREQSLTADTSLVEIRESASQGLRVYSQAMSVPLLYTVRQSAGCH